MSYIDNTNEYIAKADMLIKSFIFEMTPIYRESHGCWQDVTVPLFTTLHATSESILVLLANQALFDADVLLRTVMEGTIKYCYLMTGSDEERPQKYTEYRVILPKIERIADHFKAVETIEILRHFSANDLRPFEILLLDDDELEELQATFSKKYKKELKQKWSYQAILRELASSKTEYKAQIGTLSTYALSSHYCHFDWSGLSSRIAQMQDLASDRLGVVDTAHALRIISNVLSMYLFRIIEYMRGNKFQSNGLCALWEEAYEFIMLIDKQQFNY